MILVVLALALWLGFNFAVVLADLAVTVREDRHDRRSASGTRRPVTGVPGLRLHG